MVEVLGTGRLICFLDFWLVLTETWGSMGVVFAGFYFLVYIYRAVFLNSTASARKSINCMEQLFADSLRYNL